MSDLCSCGATLENGSCPASASRAPGISALPAHIKELAGPLPTAQNPEPTEERRTYQHVGSMFIDDLQYHALHELTSPETDPDSLSFLQAYLRKIYQRYSGRRIDFELQLFQRIRTEISEHDECLRNYGGNPWYYHMKRKYPDGQYPPYLPDLPDYESEDHLPEPSPELEDDAQGHQESSYRSATGSVWNKNPKRGGQYGRDVYWTLYGDRGGAWKPLYLCVHYRDGWYCKDYQGNNRVGPFKKSREAMDGNTV